MIYLDKLLDAVTECDRQRRKWHKVFESSVDAKELRTKAFMNKNFLVFTTIPVQVCGILLNPGRICS
jgi:hypothetical protein